MPRPSRSIACIALLAGCASFAGPAAAQPAGATGTAARSVADSTPLQKLLSDAALGISRGESRAAYEALRQAVPRYAGLPEFDYLLGLAALDCGEPGAAILALERVLAVNPGHLQARAEIARAYLANNEREAAREQFEAVAAGPIPAEVRKVVDRYLAGLAQAEAAASGQQQVYLELGTGYDSNVNFGSASGQWLLANGSAVTPLPVNQPQSSALMSVTLGGFRVRPMDGGWSATIGGTLSHRASPSAHTLDQSQMDVSLGLQKKWDKQTLDMQAQFQHLRLDQHAFRNAAGALAQWRRDLDARTQAGAYLQGFEFSFPDQSVRNARRLTAGLTFARLLAGPQEPVLVANLYGGNELTRDQVPQLDFHFHGLRTALNFRLEGGWRAYASVSYEVRQYAGAEPLFGVVREDRQTDLRVGADKDISRNWTLSPQLIASRNASTLAPSDFRRVQALVYGRYRF